MKSIIVEVWLEVLHGCCSKNLIICTGGSIHISTGNQKRGEKITQSQTIGCTELGGRELCNDVIQESIKQRRLVNI